MQAFTQILFVLLLASATVFFVIMSLHFSKKSNIENGISVQSSTGDSEVMSFSFNFTTDDDDVSKTSKVKEAFKIFQARRDENHAAFLAIKAAAIEENEEKIQNGEKLALRSVTQAQDQKVVQ